MYKLTILLGFTFLSVVAVSQNIYSAYDIFTKNEIPALTWETNGLKGKVKEVNYANVYLNQDPGKEERVKFGKRLVFYKNGFLDSIFIRNHPTNYIFELQFHYYTTGDTVFSAGGDFSTGGLQETKTVFNKSRLPVYCYNKWAQFANWFVYDKQQRIVTVITKTYHQPSTYRNKYTYRKMNDILSLVSEDEKSGDYFMLNKSMQKTMQVYVNALNAEKTVISYKYDKNGNMILREKAMYRKVGNAWKSEGKVNKIKYTYKYDTQNNWIEKLTYADEVLTELEKRTILYWQNGS